MVPVGSSLKQCLIAEGAADFYPRLGPTMEWDTAAAHAVLECAGGRIVDREVRGVVVASFALAADGTLRGAASIDDPMTVKAARRIIDRGIVVDAAALADPAVPVKSLARG